MNTLSTNLNLPPFDEEPEGRGCVFAIMCTLIVISAIIFYISLLNL